MTVALLGAVGCAGRKPSPPPQMTLDVHSTQKTNDGQLFYLVVRTVNEKQFLTDTYQAVAGMVFADPPNPSVLGAHVIYPGRSQTLKVTQPAQNSVGFYFLFTDPGDRWKRLVSQPLASAYQVVIDEDQVQVSVKKGFFRRLWPF